MKKKQSLNVVIPVYNEEKELATNITTLVDFLQKHLAMINWQMSIVDNASTDRTYAIARDLSLNNKRITALAARK